MIRRILLFLAVNFLVVATISIVLSIFQVQPYLAKHGLQYGDLLLFCLIWGMGGAFISLALSRVMAKWMLGVKLVDPMSREPHLLKLLELVASLSKKGGLPQTPQVGIYQSNEMNAFATGPTKRRSLIAVSSGLLAKMDLPALEGVIAHEISHIANGDMVTMTLLQGVVNAFVMFLARVLAFAISGMGREQKRGSYASFMILTFVFQSLFMILGSMAIFWFSRWREYRADRGGAYLAGKNKMIHALEGLQRQLPQLAHQPDSQAAVQAFKISVPSKKGIALLFASHPPIETRIERLKELSL